VPVAFPAVAFPRRCPWRFSGATRPRRGVGRTTRKVAERCVCGPYLDRPRLRLLVFPELQGVPAYSRARLPAATITHYAATRPTRILRDHFPLSWCARALRTIASAKCEATAPVRFVAAALARYTRHQFFIRVPASATGGAATAFAPGRPLEPGRSVHEHLRSASAHSAARSVGAVAFAKCARRAKIRILFLDVPHEGPPTGLQRQAGTSVTSGERVIDPCIYPS